MSSDHLRLAGAALAAAVFTLLAMWLGLRVAGPATHGYNLGSLQLEVTPSFSGKAVVFIPLAGWEIEAPVFSAPYAVRAEPQRVSPTAIKRAAHGLKETIGKTKRDLKRAAILTFVRAFLFALAGALAAAAFVALLLRAFGRPWRPSLFSGSLCLAFAVVVVGASGLWIWQSLHIKAFKHPRITLGHGKALTTAKDELDENRHVEGILQDLATLVARGQRIKVRVPSASSS